MFRRKWNLAFLVSGLAFLLAGCPDETPIQQKFLGDRNFCQNMAETKMELYTGASRQDPNDADQNTQLIAFYGECMRSRNWAVGHAPEDKKDDKKPGEGAKE